MKKKRWIEKYHHDFDICQSQNGHKSAIFENLVILIAALDSLGMQCNDQFIPRKFSISDSNAPGNVVLTSCPRMLSHTNGADGD